jgi:hypothetical protein
MPKKYSLTRTEQLSRVMYPHLADKDSQDEMKKMAAAQRKRPPHGPELLDHQSRQHLSPLGGKAK